MTPPTPTPGAVSFEDGLRVVCTRAEAMAAAASVGEPHGMLSVVGLGDDVLGECVRRAAAEVPPVAGGTVCQVANALFPQVGYVCVWLVVAVVVVVVRGAEG